MIGTTGDPATPYEYAEDMADQLRSGVLVTFDGEGHLAFGSSECVNRLVVDYLVGTGAAGQDPTAECSACSDVAPFGSPCIPSRGCTDNKGRNVSLPSPSI